ncbi:MAG: WHG domain-containing protein [Deltaproteobacteria bacterium]|nr:WHG domain-containing protein [Deltaproteobacteria bacterium]
MLEQLRAMGVAYLRFGIDNPTYYRLIFQDSAVEPTPEQHARLRTSWVIMRDTLAAWLVERQLHDVDRDQAANILWAMVHGLVSLHLAGRLVFSDPQAILTHYDVATSRWFAGLIAMHGSPAQEPPQSRVRTRRHTSTRRSRQRARRKSL